MSTIPNKSALFSYCDDFAGEAARTLGRTALIFTAALALTSCATARVWSDKGTDLSSIRPGITQNDVENVLYIVEKGWTNSTGVHYRVYKYEGETTMGTKAYVSMADIMTLGLISLGASSNHPETKYTRHIQHRVVRVAISFDEADRVLGVFSDYHDFDLLPDDGRSKAESGK